jgi:hypothetical protein
LESVLVTCGERITRYFNDIEIQVYLCQENLTTRQCAEIVIGMERKKLLQQCADEEISKQVAADPIEVYLRYELSLKEVLNLPISTLHMLYSRLAEWVTQQMLESGKTKVLAKTTEPKDLTEILMSYDAWKEHVESVKKEKVEEIDERFIIEHPLKQPISNYLS